MTTLANQGTLIDGGSEDGMTVGTATRHFFGLPGTLTWWEFLGVAFIVFVVARAWARHVNSIV